MARSDKISDSIGTIPQGTYYTNYSWTNKQDKAAIKFQTLQSPGMSILLPWQHNIYQTDQYIDRAKISMSHDHYESMETRGFSPVYMTLEQTQVVSLIVP